MINIKYVYNENGQQEAIIIPIDFWNDMSKKFDLKENYFLSKYSELLLNLHISEINTEKKDDIFSLFGSWQSDKTGDDIANEIYSSR